MRLFRSIVLLCVAGILVLPNLSRATINDRYHRVPTEPIKFMGTARVGVRGGVGSSSLTGFDMGSSSETDKYTAGGVYFTFWITETLAIETELNYAKSRGIQSVSNFVFDPQARGGSYSYFGNISWELTHIEVPILFRWATSDAATNPDGSLKIRMFEPFFEFGTGLSFKLAEGHQEKIKTTVDGISPKLDYVKWGATQFSLVVGTGANLKAGPGFLSLQVRFQAGFANVSKADEAYRTTIAILTGYGWRIR